VVAGLRARVFVGKNFKHADTKDGEIGAMRWWWQSRLAARMPYWIQRADYSSTDFDPMTLRGARVILSTHDWPAELSYARSLEQAGTDMCPPGVGFVPGAGRVLHICPREEGSAHCFYEDPQGRWHRDNVRPSEQRRSDAQNRSRRGSMNRSWLVPPSPSSSLSCLRA
jgi:hypothetical protein